MERYCTPEIPNGWFQIAYSDEIKPGDVKPLRYFGKDLVAWRSEEGELSVLDAFCPHLGAHLGHGGKVKGGEIECPFHAWRFGTDGRCAAVPYAKHVPRKASLDKWHTKEVAGMVMCWHHTEGKAPQWDIPDEVPEHSVGGVRNDEWSQWEMREWKIRSRNQEMAENAVDSAHFHYLHGTTNMPQSEASVDGHILRVYSGAGMETPRGTADGSIESLNYGFGFAVVRFKGIVETINIGCTTPIDSENVHLRFNFSVKKVGGKSDITKGVGKAFVAEVTRQLEQDIPIWENKVQYDKPLLCDGDGPIGLFRRWCTQFYTWPEEKEAAE